MKIKKTKILGLVLALIIFFTNLPFGMGIVHAEAGGVDINVGTFPDENFRTYVENNFDRNNDNYLSEDELNLVNKLNVAKKDIRSLKGIENFKNLIDFDCSSNQLTELDLSKNLGLMGLNCESNQLTKLDFTNNLALVELNCASNQLTELYLRNSSELKSLYCDNNQLTSLNVSKNTDLGLIDCAYNNLTSLNIENNSKLQQLYCDKNQLTSLNVSKNTDLERISCKNNNIDNIISNLSAKLTALECSNNKLKKLKVDNPLIEYIECSNNELEEINLDNNYALKKLICNNNQLTILNVNYNRELTDLECRSNQLTDLDLKQNSNLLNLECSSNQLTDLDLKANTKLKKVICNSNKLTSLDLSNNTVLENFSGTNQEYGITVNKYTKKYKYKEFPGQFNKDKVTSPAGANFENDALIVNTDNTSKVTYNYNVDNKNVMKVTLDVTYKNPKVFVPDPTNPGTAKAGMVRLTFDATADGNINGNQKKYVDVKIGTAWTDADLTKEFPTTAAYKDAKKEFKEWNPQVPTEGNVEEKTFIAQYKDKAFDPANVASIKVKTQPTNLSYTEGEKLSLAGLVVTLTDKNEITKDLALADFQANGITTSPLNEAVLSLSDNNKPVTISKGSFQDETKPLTVNAKKFELTLEPQEKITVENASSDNKYDKDSTITFTVAAAAEPNKKAKVEKIVGQDKETLTAGQDGKYSFTITADTKIQVTYEDETPVVPAVDKFELTLEPQEKITVENASSDNKYEKDSTITFTVAKEENKKAIVKKIVGQDEETLTAGQEGKYSFTITADTKIQVTYEDETPVVPAAEKFELTLEPQEKITVENASSDNKYDKDSTITFTVAAAEPNKKAKVEKIVGQDKEILTAGQDGKYSFTITADTTIKVTYEEDTEAKELAEAKAKAKKDIGDLANLSEDEKAPFIKKVDDAETKADVSKVLKEAKNADDLKAYKNKAKEDIGKLPNLSDTEKDKYKGEVDKAATKQDVNEAVADAKTKSDLNKELEEAKKAADKAKQEADEAKKAADAAKEAAEAAKAEADKKAKEAEEAKKAAEAEQDAAKKAEAEKKAAEAAKAAEDAAKDAADKAKEAADKAKDAAEKKAAEEAAEKAKQEAAEKAKEAAEDASEKAKLEKEAEEAKKAAEEAEKAKQAAEEAAKKAEAEKKAAEDAQKEAEKKAKEAEEKVKENEKKNAATEEDKNKAKDEIDKLPNLSKDEKNEAKDKVDKAKTKEDVKTVVDEAKVEDAKKAAEAAEKAKQEAEDAKKAAEEKAKEAEEAKKAAEKAEQDKKDAEQKAKEAADKAKEAEEAAKEAEEKAKEAQKEAEEAKKAAEADPNNAELKEKAKEAEEKAKEAKEAEEAAKEAEEAAKEAEEQAKQEAADKAKEAEEAAKAADKAAEEAKQAKQEAADKAKEAEEKEKALPATQDDKGKAKEEIDKLPNLSDNDKKEAKDKVDNAKTKGEVEKEVEDAKAKSERQKPSPEPEPYRPYWPDYREEERPYRPHRPYRRDKAEVDTKTVDEEKVQETNKYDKFEVVLFIKDSILQKSVNGVVSQVRMDIAPFIYQSRTMLPIRYVAEALGFMVTWDANTRTVYLVDKENIVQIPVNTNNIIVNGKTFTSDVKSMIKNNRTMLPVANVARALGLEDGKDILWDAAKAMVTLRRNVLK